MTVQIHWDDDAHSILRFEIERDWNWPAFWVAFEGHSKEVQNLPYRIDVISDASKIRGLPSGSFTEFRKFEQISPDNVVLTVVVVTSPFARATIGTFTQIFKNVRFRFAGSLDEARRIIAEHRAHDPLVSRSSEVEMAEQTPTSQR
jgi:hypothetical protein